MEMQRILLGILVGTIVGLMSRVINVNIGYCLIFYVIGMGHVILLDFIR